MKNLKTFTLVCCSFGVVHATAQTTKTIGGFNHVESVATDNRFIYVADIGKELNPTAKDGDGKIFKLDLQGKILDSVFVKEILNAPKGLAIAHGILFLADIDRVVAIEIKTGNKLYEIDFSKDAAFLNDMAILDKNTLFVSATDKNKIFKINLKDKTYSELITDKIIAGTNGLFADKKTNRLYVNGFGSDNNPNGIAGYINLKDNTCKQLGTVTGYFDGIFLSKGKIYLSNWVAFEKKGIIQTVNLADNSVSEVKMPEPIAGPADFIILKNQLIIPGMMSGTIHFIALQ